DQYLTNIAWEPDERHLVVVHLDRATQHLRMVRYDALSGEPVATLLEEHDDKYLEQQEPHRFLTSRPTWFIWQSQRAGWPHLYLYDIKKGLVRQLTRGEWVVKDILGMDPKESFVVVSGTAPIQRGNPVGATETHLYRVDLATGRTTRLTTEPGTHRGQLSSDGRTLVDSWSSITVPGRTELIDARTGQVLKRLVNSHDPMADVVHGEIELI